MTPMYKLSRGFKQGACLSAWRRVAVVIVLAAQFTACGSSNGAAGGATGGPIPPMGPTVGEHALVFQRLHSGMTSIQTPALSTFAGSTMVVSVGRGDISEFEPPTDNMNNGAYARLGSVHAYTNWPNSGTALYTMVDAAGGAGHVISTNTPSADEITLAVVEIYGGQIEDAVWNEVMAGQALTSASVTTNGPATLVAFWWGDAGSGGEKTAVPDGDFTVIDSILESGSLVQCAVAVRHVETAGRYDVTWTSTPTQGAQMWLVAVAD